MVEMFDNMPLLGKINRIMELDSRDGYVRVVYHIPGKQVAAFRLSIQFKQHLEGLCENNIKNNSCGCTYTCNTILELILVLVGFGWAIHNQFVGHIYLLEAVCES